MLRENLNYDVVIVGAGPAGLMAGKVLAEGGKKVAILEKKPIVGDKVCAGGLTMKDFREFGLPKTLIEKEFIKIYLNFKKYRQELSLATDTSWLWTCDRKKLGAWQMIEAKKAGVEIYLNHGAIKIERDFVQADDNNKFYFKHLIGADGSSSIVRKFLNLPTKKILVAIQYLDFNAQNKQLEIYFDLAKFGPTYAWVFPHSNYTSVGCGANAELIKSGTLKENFDNWCEELGMNFRKDNLQGAPINYDYQGIEFGNIYLVGDAAGLASGLTGEGIHPALTSGYEIAKKIIDPNYKLEKIKRVIENKNLEEKILKLYKHHKKFTQTLFYLGFGFLKSKDVRKKLINFLTEK